MEERCRRMTSLGTKGRTVTQAVQTEREKVIKARENKSGKHTLTLETSTQQFRYSFQQWA